jgi:hypothetical protein
LDVDGLNAFLTATLTPVARRGNWLAGLARRLFGSSMLREAVDKGEGGGDQAEVFQSDMTRHPEESSGRDHEEAKP